jgi:hypothetical protein
VRARRLERRLDRRDRRVAPHPDVDRAAAQHDRIRRQVLAPRVDVEVRHRVVLLLDLGAHRSLDDLRIGSELRPVGGRLLPTAASTRDPEENEHPSRSHGRAS